MKNMKNRLFAILLALVCLFAVTAQATTVTQDGLEVVMTTDKASYEAGEEINISLSIKNVSEKEMKSVEVDYTVPKQCINDSSKNISFETGSLAVNEVFTARTALHIGMEEEPETEVPATGDGTPLLLWVVLLAGSAAMLCTMKADARKRFFVLLLAATMLTSLVPSGMTFASAEGEILDEILPLEDDGEEIILPDVDFPVEEDEDAEGEPSVIVIGDEDEMNVSFKAPEKDEAYESFLALVDQLKAESAKSSAAPAPSAETREIVISKRVMIMGEEVTISATLKFGQARGNGAYADMLGPSIAGSFTGDTVIAYIATNMNGSTTLPDTDGSYPTYADLVYCLGGGNGTVSMILDFSSYCNMESDWDAIILYNGYGDYLDYFTGTELANQIIQVEGPGAFIRLVSDGSVSRYGFSLDQVIPVKTPVIDRLSQTTASKPELEWTKLYGFTGFSIERAEMSSDGSISKWKKVRTVANGDAVRWVNSSGVSKNKLYVYRMRQSLVIGGETVWTPYSAEKKVYTLAKPVISSITPITSGSTKQVRLNWQAVSGATKYAVVRSTSKSGTYTVVGQPTTNTFTDTVPDSGVYYYKVRAYKKFAGGTYPGALTTAQMAVFLTAPTGLSAVSSGYDSVTVKWRSVSGATGYELYRSGSSSGTYTRVKRTTSLQATVSAAKATGLSYYKVRAYKTVNGSTVYGPYSSVIGQYPLNKPVNLKASTLSNGNFRLKWNAVTNAQGYELFYSDSSTGTYTKFADVTALSHTMSELPGNLSTAYFRVRAYRNDSGYKSISNTSNTVSITGSTSNPVTLRNLYIMQEYFPASSGASDLPCYDVDVPRLNRIFNAASPYGRPVTASYPYSSLSKSSVLSKISMMASLADDNDVTVVAMSTHGASGITSGSQAGMILMSDGSFMTFGEYSTALQQIPGRVVIIMDSCGSGSSIGKGAQSQAEIDAFNNAFIDAIEAVDEEITFADENTAKTGELCVANKFYVITAARGGESSWLGSNGSYILIWIEEGLTRADTNSDGTITLAEMGTFLYNKGWSTTFNGSYRMIPQIYPTGSTFPIFVDR